MVYEELILYPPLESSTTRITTLKTNIGSQSQDMERPWTFGLGPLDSLLLCSRKSSSHWRYWHSGKTTTYFPAAHRCVSIKISSTDCYQRIFEDKYWVTVIRHGKTLNLQIGTIRFTTALLTQIIISLKLSTFR